MQFEILADWDHLLDSFPDAKKDIYYSKKYVELYETQANKPLCAVCSDDDNIMLFPFLRGEICGHYDFETAYGYGGPVSNTDDSTWNREAFWGIYDYLKTQNYICGFTRLHPLLENEMLIPDESIGRNIKKIYDRQTISIDTSQSEEEIWSTQISSKNRNMIRKAEKNGLEYRTEYDFESYDEFIELYQSTMARLSADEFYFFDRTYFEKLKASLSGNSFLGTVRKDGKLICAAIFFYSKNYGHYHLEGSDRNYSSLGANNLLLWKVACEFHKLGVKSFHLGGGTSSSEDDSLYKFKKAFSNNEKKFYIVKEIFDSPAYDTVVKDWENCNPDKVEKYSHFLLKYRY